jgi:hypothetical protein
MRDHCWNCHPQVRVQRSTFCEVLTHRGKRRVFGDRVFRAVVKTPVRGELRECWACDVCITKGLAQHYAEGTLEPSHVERAPLKLFGVKADNPRIATWVGDVGESWLSGVWLTDGVNHRSVDGGAWYAHVQVRQGYTLKVREDRLNEESVRLTASGMVVLIYGYQPTAMERYGHIHDLWEAFPMVRDCPVKGRIV